jgi:heat shock protein HtpX
LVLTLVGIAAVAGSLLLGDGGLWLALAAAGFACCSNRRPPPG